MTSSDDHRMRIAAILEALPVARLAHALEFIVQATHPIAPENVPEARSEHPSNDHQESVPRDV